MAEHLENCDVEEIELFDDDGECMKFQLLDTIKMDGKMYVVLTYAIDEDEMEEEEENDVYIMSLVENDGEDVLELIEDDEELKRVFNEFKKYTQGEYDFADDD